MLFQFISFWLAAPEIIGDKNLKRMQDMIKNLFSNLSVIILSVLVPGYALLFKFNGAMKGLESSSSGITPGRYYSTVLVAMMLYMIFTLRFKYIKLWIDNRISSPLPEKHIHYNRLHRKSLVSSTYLFTTVFLIQFLIILFEP